MMIAHDTREKKARTIRTAFAVIPAEMKSWAMFEPPASVMVSGDSLSGCVPRRTRLGPSRQGSTESSSGSKRWKVLAALVAALALGFAGPARTAPLPDDILPLAAVKAGMKGYGLTVLHGTAVERFDVEVLGVVPNSLGRSQILVRVSGLGLDKTGILAGMSGSPVYFEGRLAGAVAATWGFSKEPIGAVTPIESMLAIDTGDAAAGTEGGVRPTSGGGGFPAFAGTLALPEEERLAALQKIVDARPSLPARAQASLLAPVAAGFPADTLGRWGRDLARLGIPVSLVSGELPALPGTALQAAERARPAAPIAPGSAVTALLIDGDLQLGATGTVTRVDGKGRFLAFGHPFLGAGMLELPVAPAEVVAVFPSAMLSFKMAYALAPAYRLTHDRDSGVAGRTDRAAALVAQNEFEDPAISGVDISVLSAPGEKRLRVVEAALSARKVAPGQTLRATVRLADRRGREETRVLSLIVPRETPEGRALVIVGDGNAASAARLAAQPAEPRTLGGLRAALGRLVPADRLAALLVVPTRGTTTGDDTLSALPPSFAMVLSEGGDANAHASVPIRILAEEFVTLDRPASGSVRLELEVERPRS